MLRQSGIDYQKQKRNRHPSRPQLIFILIGTLIALAAIGYFFIWLSLAPMRTARIEAEEVANSAGITKTEQFFVSNDSDVYYSIIGRTNSGEQKVAIIKKNSQQATILLRKDGLTASQLTKLIEDNYQPAKIYSTALSIYQDQPVWQVAFLSDDKRLNYVLLDYQSGEEYQIIKGI